MRSLVKTLIDWAHPFFLFASPVEARFSLLLASAGGAQVVEQSAGKPYIARTVATLGRHQAQIDSSRELLPCSEAPHAEDVEQVIRR